LPNRSPLAADRLAKKFGAKANLEYPVRVSMIMPSYVANHEKKKRIFAKRERELLHAIKHNSPQEKLFLAAENLRTAKIRVFKCRFSANKPNQPHTFSPQEMAAKNKQFQEWLLMSSEEIVDRYRSEVK
jgi:hypothetical protein